MLYPYDSIAFTLTIDRQTWRGHYMGEGRYVVRYSPKQPDISDARLLSGVSDYEESRHQQQKWQGAATVSKWRQEVMQDLARRFGWLR